jgi:type IV pilus assembly protein PilO
MAMADTVKGWPWYGQAILFLLVGAGLFYVGHRFMVKPINEEMSRLNIEREELLAEINKGETLKARFIEFEAELKRLESQLDSLKRILPSTEEIADLYSRIQQEGTELGLNIMLFKPGNHVPKEYYDEWPISMTLNGNYHILAKFFERIGKLYRIINVNDFAVKNTTGKTAATSTTIQATCVATTFIYKEGSAAAKPTTKKRGGKT